MAGHYAEIVRTLRFWFEEAGPEAWFKGGPGFDTLCRERLGDLHGQAAAGTHDAWAGTPEGSLALCILLDQVPRNIFRGTARAFATDARALEVARAALERGFDQGMREEQRVFLYLPFEHSESLEDQRTAVRLFAGRTVDPLWLDYACRHLAVIHRYGRFPHRNAALGRETTAAEAAWLAMPDSGF